MQTPQVYGVTPSPYVKKVLVTLDTKGIEYELIPTVPVDVSAEYKQMNPLGKIPTYKADGITLCDSSVICAYLEKIHPTPAIYPSAPEDYARALWFEEFSDDALMKQIGPEIFFNKIVAPIYFGSEPDQTRIDNALQALQPLFNYLESELTGQAFLINDQFTIADISLASVFGNYYLSGYSIDGGHWPKLKVYIETLHQQPSFKKLLANDREKLKL